MGWGRGRGRGPDWIQANREVGRRRGREWRTRGEGSGGGIADPIFVGGGERGKKEEFLLTLRGEGEGEWAG